MANRGIKNPQVTYPTSPTSFGPTMPPHIPDPSISHISFEQLLANRGVRFLHRKATPCPNMISLNGGQHDPECTLCDHDGFVYYKEKEIIGSFIGNTMEKIFEYQGVWDIGSTMATFPTIYPDGTEADFNTMDKLVMLDFEVRLWELTEWKNAPINLRYPVVGVEYMAAAVDGVMQEYEDGVDFDIVDGSIVFRDGHEPEYNETERNGEVITISYFANPVYIVLHPLRELRVSQEFVNGEKVTQRLPQQLILKRDWMPNAAGRSSK